MSVLITLHSLCPQALVIIVCMSAVLNGGKEDSAPLTLASVLRLFSQEFPKPLLAPSVNLGQDFH